MAYSHLSTNSNYDFVIKSDTGHDIVLPENFIPSAGGFERAGPDLIIQNIKGQNLLLQDYYVAQPENIIAGPGKYSSQMIEGLTTGPAPAQYAQVDNAITGEAIGQIETVEGVVSAVRAHGTSVTLKIGDPVFQGDVIRTDSSGNIGITFKDESSFSLAENGEITLDEMVYSPDSGEGSFSTSLASGVFSFVSGQIAKTNPDAMAINTPVATIGIRGTQGVLNQTRGGQLQAALLEELDGLTGELILTNSGGSIIMNQPNQYSAILSFTAAPGQPVTINFAQISGSFGSQSIRTLNNVRKAASARKAQEKQAEADAEQQAADQAQAEADAALAEAETLAAQAEALAAEAAELDGAEAEALLAEAEALAAQAAEAEALALAAQAQASTLAASAAAAQAAAAQAQQIANSVAAASASFENSIAQAERQLTQLFNQQRQNLIQNTNPNDPDIDPNETEKILKGIQKELGGIVGDLGNPFDDPFNEIFDEQFAAEQNEIFNQIQQDLALAIAQIDVSQVGTSGADTLSGSALRDGLAGLGGNDELSGLGGVDVIIGGSGNDIIYGGDGNDFLHGDIPDDIITFGAIYDIVSQDTGSDGSDLIYGGAGDDVIAGGGGNDALYGDYDNDTINGDDGADTLYGGMGNDILSGDTGDDSLHAGEGSDILIGGLGNDTLYAYADSESNIYDGGDGTDILNINTDVEVYETELTLNNADSGSITYRDESAGNIGTDSFTGIEKFDFGTSNDKVTLSAQLNSASDVPTLNATGGTDTLVIQSGSFDFTTLDSLSPTLTGFDNIDLTTTDTSLEIDGSFTSNGVTTVYINGGSGDSVDLKNAWEKDTISSGSDPTYDHFTNGGYTLRIDKDIGVTNFTTGEQSPP